MPAIFGIFGSRKAKRQSDRGVSEIGAQLIDKNQAIEIARRYADAKRWVFVEPVCFDEGRPLFGPGKEPTMYKLWTNAEGLGAKAWFEIDRIKGEVIAARYVPR